MPRVVIVGGGISGLSTAFYLAKSGIRPTLIEREPRPGGVIRTEKVEGCLVEGGPEAFLSAKPWAMELIGELGLTAEVIGSNDGLRATYVVRNGRLVRLPEGLIIMAPTRAWPVLSTRLLSWTAKLRMALELLRRHQAEGGRDRSVAEFIREHYGQEAIDYLTEPLLAGVYGGEPEQMSAQSVLPRLVELERKYGSITRGVMAEREQASSTQPVFRTLKGGMGQLIDAIAARNPADLLQGRVEILERSGAGYRMRVSGEWMEADVVVLACPAHEAARIIGGLHAELGGLLETIPYTSSMTVALGYARSAVAHPLNGFGFLVPARERTGVVACTWVGTKFSFRVPDHMALIRCFFKSVDLSDAAAVIAAREDLRRLMGIVAEPAFTRISRWPLSMAQYTVGHQERISKIENCLTELPGVHLAGNAYYGIGIPDCVRLGKQVAEKIVNAP